MLEAYTRQLLRQAMVADTKAPLWRRVGRGQTAARSDDAYPGESTLQGQAAKVSMEFADGQLRTFQRRVKAWRLEQASSRFEMSDNIGENLELATIR